MASQNEIGFRSFIASGAISAYKAVTIQSDGTITPSAGNADIGVGITQQDIADAGYGTVKLWTAPGTFLIQATGSAVMRNPLMICSTKISFIRHSPAQLNL